MGGTPNVAGMMADSDFQGLAPGDKRAALAKVTGDKSFLSLNDGDTMQFVSRFQVSPEQSQINQLPNPAAQSKQQTMARAPGLTRDTGLYPNSINVPGDQAAAAMKGKLAGMTGTPDVSYVTPDQAKTGIGVGLTAGGMMMAPGATIGGLAGSAALDKGFTAAASALGASPEKAQMWGTTGSIVGGLGGGEFGGRLGGVAKTVIMRQIAKLSGETPERLAQLGQYFPAKESLEQQAVAAEAQSRTAFKGAYNNLGLDASPVNVTGARRVAQMATDELSKVASVPAPAARVAAIPGPAIPGEFFDEPQLRGALRDMTANDNIPFRQAQQYRSAIEQYISKMKPPANVYNALKQVSGSLTDGLQSTAASEGKAAEFAAAEKMFKDHAGDFWNKGAPLKPFLNTMPGTKPATLNKFLNTANDSRALEALDRRGIDTGPVRKLLAKGAATIQKDVPDAATLRNLGQPVLNQQVGAVNTAKVKNYALKTGAGAIGAGGLYELIRQLSTGAQQARPTP